MAGPQGQRPRPSRAVGSWIDAEPLEPAVDLFARFSERARRLGDVAAVHAQLLLELLLERDLRRRHRCSRDEARSRSDGRITVDHGLREMLETDWTGGRERGGDRERLLELSDVPRPVIRELRD